MCYIINRYDYIQNSKKQKNLGWRKGNHYAEKQIEASVWCTFGNVDNAADGVVVSCQFCAEHEQAQKFLGG